MIKTLHLSKSLALVALILFMLIPGWGQGQTPYVMSGGDYSEIFTNIANTTNWPNGFNGTDSQEWASVLVNASGTLGDGVKTTVSTATFSTTTSGGVQRGSANIYLLSTSTANACAIDLLLNFTGRNAGTISFDVATVFNGSGNRDSKLKLFYSTDGTTFTEITGTNLPYTAENNVASSVSITTISLPAVFNNSSTARLRFYEYSTTLSSGTPSGSQPKISIDNIAVTSTPSGSSSSDIIGAANETSNIAYSSYQASSITATSDAVRLFSFTVRDGGGSTDADALPTILASATLTKGVSNSVTNWANTIREAALFDGSTKVAEVSVTGESIAFTGLSGANVTAADGGTKTLDLYVTFESAVTDNQQFQFQITNTNVVAAASGSSTFSAFTAVLSSVATDANKIEVTATDISYIQGVSTVAMTAVMSPSPTLKAIDANGNTDLDYSGGFSVAVTVGSVTFDPGATTTGSFSSGLLTLSNLKFNTAGTSNKITVTSGSFNKESGAFDVTNPQPEINVKQASTNYLSNNTYTFGSQVSGTSSTAIAFTIENLGSATLNLTGSPKIAISGTNASEFTVDQTATTATVAVSGSTTFTITFNPGSQGSKTAAISIANDDATGSESPYIINLTGTGTVSATSDIANTSGYPYTSNVAYASYQAVATLTTGNSIGVNGLTLRDGAGSSDADNLGTTLTALSFSTNGSTAIRTAALFDGSTNVSEVAVNGATTIAFSGLTLAAADNGTKDFELRVTYQATVTDNQQITFTVSAATASTAGSNFGTANAGAAASAVTVDINRIEVTATLLAFLQQPSNTTIGVNMTPSVTVKAIDANTNTDLDFASAINITSSGTLSSSPQSATAASGISTFSTINHTVAATSLTLTAASGGLASATSNSFNITALPVVAWQFGSPASTGDEATYNATTNNTNLNTSVLSRGTGIIATALVRGFSANTWDASTKATAVSTNEYYQFTINPKANYKVSLSTLDATLRRTSTAPNAYIWKYSIDGSSFNEIGSDVSFTSTADGVAQTQIDLSGITALQNVPTTTTITFRIYAWGGTATSATFAIARYAAGITTNCLAIGGTFVSVEPTNHVTSFAANTSTTTSIALSWTDATGAQLPQNYLVKASVSPASPTAPSDGTAESNSALVHNVAYGVGGYTFTGLNPNTTYNFSIWPYTNSGASIDYKTSPASPTASATTFAGEYRSIATGNWGAPATWESSVDAGSNWATPATEPGNTDNVTIKTSHTVTVDGALKTSKNLTIESGAVLAIDPGKSLTVSGPLANSGGTAGLLINSDATGTGSLIHATDNVDATVKRYISGSVGSLTSMIYHQVSVPLTQSSNPTTNLFYGSYMYKFVESASTNGDWLGLGASTTRPLGVDTGYLIYYPAASIVYSFEGKLRNGSVSPVLSFTDLNHGYNLIPNPYPSAIDWHAAQGWSLTRVNDAIYVWNSTANIGSYGSYVGTASTNGVTNIIPEGQAFMVRTNAASPAISMDNRVRVHNTTAFMKNSSTANPYELHLFAAAGTVKDETAIRFADDVTDNFDSHADAYKLYGYPETPQINSVTPDGTKLSINSLPFNTGDMVVPLNFILNANTDVTLSATGLESFFMGIPIYLEDLSLNKVVDLRTNPVYTFNHIAGHDNNRFQLRFLGVTSTPEHPEVTAGNIFVSQGNLFVDVPSMLQSEATISVYDALGRQFSSRKSVMNGIMQLAAPTATGVYIVRVMSGSKTFTAKVVVK